MRQFLLGLYFLCFLNVASGQEIPLPENMPQEHPRVLTTPEGKWETWNLIKTEAWAEDVFNKLKERTEAYTRLTDVQPTWLLSRLAMFISVNRKERGGDKMHDYFYHNLGQSMTLTSRRHGSEFATNRRTGFCGSGSLCLLLFV